MGIGLKEFCVVVLLALLSNQQSVFGIRFVIDQEECFSYDVKYGGDTIHVSFVVIKVDSSWHYSNDGVDLVVSFIFLRESCFIVILFCCLIFKLDVYVQLYELQYASAMNICSSFSNV